MRSRLLTLVVLGVAAWALWTWARSQDTAFEARPDSGLLYPDLDPAHVQRVYLQLTGGQSLELERGSGQRWRITFPTQEVAREALVEQVLDNLLRATVRPIERLGPQIRARDVGLEPPRHVIGFSYGDNMRTLLLGEIDPLGKYLYARRQGEAQIVLVTSNLATWLQMNGDEWVDPSLLRELKGRATRVRVVRPPDGVVVDAVRSGGRWNLQGPQAVLADNSRIEQLVQVLRSIEQMRVANSRPTPAVLHELGLPDAADVERGELRGATLLELSAEGQPPDRAFLVAGWEQSGDEVLAIRGDLKRVLLVPGGALALLGNSADWFREHRLLAPVRTRAARVRLRRGSEVLLDIRRDKTGAWAFTAPARVAGEAVETHRIDGRSPLLGLMGRLDRLRVVGFSEPIDGEGEAELAIGWTHSGRERLERVFLYGPDGDVVRARSTERPAEGLLVEAGILDLFDPFVVDELRTLTPLSVDRDAWAGLRIELPDARFELTREQDGPGWVGDDAWGRRYGLGLDLLRGLRGYSWQAARKGARYPWAVDFLDAGGNSLGRVAFRLPAQDEEPEAHGYPAAMATCTGFEGLELIVPRRLWVGQLETLTQRPERTPAPGADG